MPYVRVHLDPEAFLSELSDHDIDELMTKWLAKKHSRHFDYNCADSDKDRAILRAIEALEAGDTDAAIRELKNLDLPSFRKFDMAVIAKYEQAKRAAH